MACHHMSEKLAVHVAQGGGELITEIMLLAAVSASHMSMPNHWLPYVLIGRAQGWSLRHTIGLTCLGATGHVLTTMAITIAVSSLGGALISEEAYRIGSSVLLFLLGIYYLYTYIVRGKRESCCDDASANSEKYESSSPVLVQKHSRSSSASAHGIPTSPWSSAEDRAAALSVVSLTTFSPCVGSMPVLVALVAPPIQLGKVVTAGSVLLVTSASVMSSLVVAALIGTARLDLARLRRHERLILGVGLIVLAGVTYAFLAHHGHDHHAHDTHLSSHVAMHGASADVHMADHGLGGLSPHRP